VIEKKKKKKRKTPILKIPNSLIRPAAEQIEIRDER
jgi:hypothetical protein